MTTPEMFRQSQRAMERGAWKGRQSQSMYEAAQEMIEKSMRLMDAARNPQPTYRAAEE